MTFIGQHLNFHKVTIQQCAPKGTINLRSDIKYTTCGFVSQFLMLVDSLRNFDHEHREKYSPVYSPITTCRHRGFVTPLFNPKRTFRSVSQPEFRNNLSEVDERSLPLRQLSCSNQPERGLFAGLKRKISKSFDTNSDKTDLNSETNSAHKKRKKSGTSFPRSTDILKLRNDKLLWSKWKVTAIGASSELEDKPQYGTTLIRKDRKRNINDTKAVLRAQSEEISYLRQIFNGEYQIPEILENERNRQLDLLARDRKNSNTKNFRKSIIDLTEKIKNILLKDYKGSTNNEIYQDDSLVFIEERKIPVLEHKRREFFKQRLNYDRSIHAFEKEFKTYKQLVIEKREIRESLQRSRKTTQSLVPSFTDEQLHKVENTLKQRTDGLLMNRDNLEIFVRDIKTLAPGRWLNDTIIEFFMKFIEKSTPNTVAFNSFFYSSLSERGYQGVRRWLRRKKQSIFDIHKIFIPVNLNQSHWALAMVDMENERIIYADSLSNGPNAMSFAILSDIKDYVIKESGNKLGEDFNFVHADCPQQPNGYDCGIYVCMNTLYLSKNSELTFTYEDAVRMRKYIAHLIVSDSLK